MARACEKFPVRSRDTLAAGIDSLAYSEKSFPAWLSMSWAWEQSMEDPGEVKAAIARNLRRLRQKRGLSLKVLAKLSRANVVALKEIESAKTLPEIGLIWKLAQVLHVPCTAFLGSDRDA